jgi:hypothetical protein
MDGDRILADQNVTVVDDKIASIEPTVGAVVPKDAEVVDASGKFLMPGLESSRVWSPGNESTDAASTISTSYRKGTNYDSFGELCGYISKPLTGNTSVGNECERTITGCYNASEDR